MSVENLVVFQYVTTYFLNMIKKEMQKYFFNMDIAFAIAIASKISWKAKIELFA